MSNSLVHIVKLAYFANVRTKLYITIRIIWIIFRNILVTTKSYRLDRRRRPGNKAQNHKGRQ